MAYGDGGPTWIYSARTIREHKVSLSIAGLALVVMLVATLLPKGYASAASSGPPAVLIPSNGAYLGAHVGQRGTETKQESLVRVESQIGRQFAIDHEYYKWDSPFPTPQESWAVSRGTIPFLNWKAQRTNGAVVPWSTIASGAEDAAIAARADAVKAFGSPIYLTFHHEPEDDLGAWGTPTDYAAAFRHVVTIFRNRGVTNVAFVWTMMNWTFEPGSGRDPNAYYPGDDYVDIIGSDGYELYPGKAGVAWESFQQVFQDTNSFALAHNKPWMAVETGAQEDPAQPGRKGQWFRDIVATAKGWPLLKAVIYFDTIKEYAPNSWQSDSSVSSIQGFTALGADPYFDPAAPAPPPAPPGGGTCSTGLYQAEYFTNPTLSGNPTLTRCEAAINNDWGLGSGPGGGIGTDNFSVRWTGSYSFTAGTYSFTARADDGIRLWVDGTLIIDEWRDQLPTTHQASRTLTAGQHQIKVEYYEKLGGAVAQVGWAPAGGGTCSTGLYQAEYFTNPTLSGNPTLTRCEAAINNDWGLGSGPGGGIGTDNFSVRWTGSYSFTAGTYSFTARADDGIRLWVDGTLIIDEWRDQLPTTHQASRTLTAGQHQIKVEYYEKLGGAVAQVGWAPAGGGTCSTGLYQAEYFTNPTLSGNPTLTRCEAAINNDWGLGSGPGGGIGTDNFSVRWTGSYSFTAGTYSFTARADDGIRLWVDGTLIIDEWRDQLPTTHQASRTLTAGQHQIKVEYYEKLGGAVAQVGW